MSLTPQQQEFLDKHVLDRSKIKTLGKRMRANGFAKMRDKLQSALLEAPSDLPEFAELMRQMRRADVLGEELKFNRASDVVKETLAALQKAIKTHRPLQESGTDDTRPDQDVKQLLGRLERTTEARDFKTPQVRSLAKDLEFPIKKAKALLKAKKVSEKDFKWAEHLIEEVESKLTLILDERERIEKSKVKLKKYLSLAQELEDITAGEGFSQLKSEVEDLLRNDSWTRSDQSAATSVHLKLMLALANGTQTQQKDFKKGETEMVLAVRRKNPKSVDENGKQASNFKMLLKPSRFEKPVEGFKAGGGAPREAMGSFLSNEFQRLMGFKLGVPDTKLVSIDGEYLMGDSVGKEGDKTFTKGQKVMASVQSFEQGCVTLGDRMRERKFEEKGQAFTLDTLVSKDQLQQMAVFDLISMNCDRHGGNVMLDGNDKLVPIDHGNIMPTKKGLRLRGTYLHPDMPSALFAKTAAAKEKLSPELIECIERLDIDGLVLSMKEQSRQMQLENDEVDLTDLNEGVDNVRRSAAFMKYAARTLTLKQIYHALASHQDLIFFSKDEESAFKTVVGAITNQENAMKMLGVTLGLPPDEEGSVVLRQARLKLTELNWVQSKGSVVVNALNSYPARMISIIEKGKALPFSQDQKQRYQEFGGDDAAARIARNKSSSSLAHLEVFHFATGEMP